MHSTIATPGIRAEREQSAAAGFIPLCVPHLEGSEWDYVRDCLDSNWVSSVGPYVGRFERALADRLGMPHAIATVNGTAALHVALLACGVEADDEVLVSTLTFIAPANAARYCGAWPVFIDVDPATWQMDVGLVERFLRDECTASGGQLRNRRTGRRVSAIVPVHILGHPVDIEPLVTLARTYGLKIVEDATESLGSLYKNRPVGTHGDAACFSFNGNKLVTTGGGGMIVTAAPKIAERAYYLTTQAKDDPVEYVHNEIGFNYRLTNIQAAMGCAQLERLDKYIEAKRSIAARYRLGLPQNLATLSEATWARATFWLYTILVEGIDRRDLLGKLQAQGIQTRPLWQPLHASPAHRGAPAVLSGAADRIHDCALSLPSSVGLSAADQERVIEAIRAAIGTA
jgi:perosamine synthetase